MGDDRTIKGPLEPSTMREPQHCWVITGDFPPGSFIDADRPSFSKVHASFWPAGRAPGIAFSTVQT